MHISKKILTVYSVLVGLVLLVTLSSVANGYASEPLSVNPEDLNLEPYTPLQPEKNGPINVVIASIPAADTDGKLAIYKRGGLRVSGKLIDFVLKSNAGSRADWVYDENLLDCNTINLGSLECKFKASDTTVGPIDIQAVYYPNAEYYPDGTDTRDPNDAVYSNAISVSLDTRKPPAPDVVISGLRNIKLITTSDGALFTVKAFVTNRASHKALVPINMSCETSEAGIGTYVFANNQSEYAASLTPGFAVKRGRKLMTFSAEVSPIYLNKLDEFKRSRQPLRCYVRATWGLKVLTGKNDYEYATDAIDSNNWWGIEFQWNGKRWVIKKRGRNV